MCGISVLVSAAPAAAAAAPVDAGTPPQGPDGGEALPTADDFKDMLRRRGPDCMGERIVTLGQDTEIHFIGSLLQLRGDAASTSPLVDGSGNILLFNGEVFEGLDMGPQDNDAAALLAALAMCSSGNTETQAKRPKNEESCAKSSKSFETVPGVLSRLRGPWALVYWQADTQTLWYGRDAVGRRSLLIHHPSSKDPRLLLTSAAPFNIPLKAPPNTNSDEEGTTDEQATKLIASPEAEKQYWEEVKPGIYSLPLGTLTVSGPSQHHPYGDEMLEIVAEQRRADAALSPAPAEPTDCEETQEAAASLLLEKLNASVATRVSCVREAGTGNSSSAPVAANVGLLFSGGVDCMILAALADRHIPPGQPIDLSNVCFANGTSPDRKTAIDGLAELRRTAPLRQWRLIQVNSSLATVDAHQQHLNALLYPSSTYMDLNIGAALWLAAGAEGWVECQGDTCEFCAAISAGGESSNQSPSGDTKLGHHWFKSKARVMLLGSGADEQCGGYGRHRTAYMQRDWEGLAAELRMDVQRLWVRNLGRDDRLIADHGREARFPYLDERVMMHLLSVPLWGCVDLRLPRGVGEKVILRKLARMLGLHGAAALPKRAIQFGSRIAKMSNVREFGSNRKANLASAGAAKYRS